MRSLAYLLLIACTATAIQGCIGISRTQFSKATAPDGAAKISDAGVLDRGAMLITLLFAVLLSFGLAGCVGIPITDVPSAGHRSATVTVVRERAFAGGGLAYYLTLDGDTVARLTNGQPTTFAVSEGQHILAVNWRPGGWGRSYHVHTPLFLAKAGEHYFFMINSFAPQYYSDIPKSVQIRLVCTASSDSLTEGKECFAPGRAPSSR